MAKKRRRKPKPKKRPQGRPRIELTPEQIERISLMKAVGLSLDDISVLLGISPATLDERIREDRLKIAAGDKDGPNVFQAIEFGKANLKDKLYKKAFAMALKDGSMLKFVLRSKYGFRESVELTGKDGAPLMPANPISTEAITQNVLAKIRKEEAADQKA
jgi:predicted DNA-binding protein (UPF0251 family)